jgi:hypothetical protein
VAGDIALTTAALDRLLAILVVAMATTGLLTLRAGAPSAGWLFALHGLIAGALLLAIALKLRRSLGHAVAGRRWGRVALGLGVSLVAVAALTGGYTWVVSGEIASIGSFTVLTLHAWAGLALVPLVIVHLLPRRWRLLRPGPRGLRRAISRRSVLAGGAFALAGAGTWGAAALLDRGRGGQQRFTGSRLLTAGSVPPATTFFGEPVPAIDLAAWRLRVGATSFSLAELQALGATDLTAVLDCTSGWAVETGWRGVPLDVVVRAAGRASAARSVVVRSVTGWSASLPIDEAEGCLLAWGVAGGPLPVENGAPLRLVVPDRRGLDWVKWVAEIDVS